MPIEAPELTGLPTLDDKTAAKLDAIPGSGVAPAEVTEEQAIEQLKLINPECEWTPEMFRAVKGVAGFLTVEVVSKTAQVIDLESIGHLRKAMQVCREIAEFAKEDKTRIAAALAIAECAKKASEVGAEMAKLAAANSGNGGNKPPGLNLAPDFSQPPAQQTNIVVNLGLAPEKAKAETGFIDVEVASRRSADGQ